jgi:hypothetical protein
VESEQNQQTASTKTRIKSLCSIAALDLLSTFIIIIIKIHFFELCGRGLVFVVVYSIFSKKKILVMIYTVKFAHPKQKKTTTCKFTENFKV